ncbi:sporulation protein YjcZ [Paenibacillus polymyxa]|nr:sporulation protein YjcZ [Paenibacillus polymyxa]RPE03298.1 sporulation protein YjcZ [Paenibacillus polymyxa]
MGGYAGDGCGAGGGTGPAVGGVWTSTGAILVLFILLVIISRALWI